MARPRLVLTPAEWLFGAALTLIVGGLLAPEWRTFKLRRQRAEVGMMLSALQDHFARQTPHAFGPLPRDTSALGTEPVPWSSSAVNGFRSPLAQVRGNYQLAYRDGAWVLLGRCDVDGDGVPAEYRAALHGPVQRRTPPTVY